MSNVETHRATHEAFNRRDYEAAVRAVREDAPFTDHGRNATVKGPLELIDWLKGWTASFSDARSTAQHYIDGGDYTVCLFRGTGTNDGPLGTFPPTGKRVDVPYCEVNHYDAQGKIVAGEIFYDAMTIMVQLGHMEPLPSE